MKKLIYACVAFLALSGCQQKELCLDHLSHASKQDTHAITHWDLAWESRCDGGIDWRSEWPKRDFGIDYDDMRPSMPEGLRIFTYNEAGSVIEQNLHPEGGKLYLPEGKNKILSYNNDYEYVVINHLSNVAEVTATTRSRTRNSFNGISGVQGSRDEATVNAPDPLFRHYIESQSIQSSSQPVYLDFAMQPLVFTYLVRYCFVSGIEYIGLARGAMSGLAECVYLTDGRTGSNSVTILFDCTIKDWGIEARVNSFGVPNYPQNDHTDNQYGLNLEVLLKNGKKLNYDFNITDQIAMQPRGGVIQVNDIEVPDSIGRQDSGMFDVSVEGWTDIVDIPIIF